MARKFLIGQLACYGDCLYASTVAKQIKTDFPDSHVTWAIASKYQSILYLNPYVDAVWEIELINNDYSNFGWRKFVKEAKLKQASGIYDELIFTQIPPDYQNYNGIIRSSILKAYNRPISVAVDPVIRLSAIEIEKVKVFAEKNNLSTYKNVILFECSPSSGQSFVNLQFALLVAENITASFKEVCFILSSPTSLDCPNPQIIDASELTFRENAELTKYCTLLIGCSSGITWLATSDWAKKLNMLQLLKKGFVIFAGVKYDFKEWRISTSSVIEVTIEDENYAINCLKTIIEEGFQPAKKKFDEVHIPTYFNFRFLIYYLLSQDVNYKLRNICTVVFNYAKKNPHLNILKLYYWGLWEIGSFYKNKVMAKSKIQTKN